MMPSLAIRGCSCLGGLETNWRQMLESGLQGGVPSPGCISDVHYAREPNEIECVVASQRRGTTRVDHVNLLITPSWSLFVLDATNR
jgi:hypothetical protein